MSDARPSRRRSPVALYGLGFVIRVFAGMWTVGGLLLGLELLLVDGPMRAEGPLGALAAFVVVTGVVAWLGRDRARAWVLLPWALLTVVVITAGIVLGGGGRLSDALAFFYVWLAIVAFLALRRAVAVAVILIAAAAHAATLIAADSGSVAVPMMLLATMGAVGVVVEGLGRARSASAVDELTGVANRTGLDRTLERELARAERDEATLAVVVLGVDGFRRVNVVQGQEAGDRLLQEIAKRWQQLLASGDLVARVTADRFAVVLTDHDPADVRRTVDELRSAMPDGVTCSAGVAFWDEGDSASLLLGRAAGALYEAKQAGRDRVVVSGEDGAATRELQRAIEHGELVLMAQPTVDAHTGHVSGFEVLVRWQHPSRGLLGPMEFIPLAERTGLVVPLGVWVLDEACRHASAWLQQFPDEAPHVAVNVSGRQLEDPGFHDTVVAVLDRHGLPAHLLTLEVTESVLADDLETWKQRLWDLRALGVELSMDDFGTGYSSLHQLRQLPFGDVKIDRSFVMELPDSPEAVATVAAVVGLAKGLGRGTVAEGVETIEQVVELRRLGCDVLQGYLLGRPEPIEQAEALLRQQARSRQLVRAVAAADPPSGPGREHARPAVAAAVEFEEVVRPLLEHLRAVGGLQSAYLTRIDWDALVQHFEIVAAAEDADEPAVTEGLAIAWADTVCRRALDEGVLHTEDARTRFPDSPAAHDLGLGAWASAPIVLPDGAVYGTLCAASAEPAAVNEELVSLLTLYSRLLAGQLAPVPR